jgi:hypothetical protein
MGRPILYHDGLFFEWSTICDAPASCAMTRAEMEEWLANFRGDTDVSERLDRAVQHGTSLQNDSSTAQEYVSWNRAGSNETFLSFDDLITHITSDSARKESGLPPLIRTV